MRATRTATAVAALSLSTLSLVACSGGTPAGNASSFGNVSGSAVPVSDELTALCEQIVAQAREDDGLAKLERQRRATRVRCWTDADGMWCLSGRFDPVTGLEFEGRSFDCGSKVGFLAANIAYALDRIASTLPVWLADFAKSDKRFTASLFVDVDNDGFPDLVLGRWPGGLVESESLILLNDGQGDFSRRTPITLPAGVFGSNTTTLKMATLRW